MLTAVIAKSEEHYQKWAETGSRSSRDYRRITTLSELRKDDDLVISLVPLSEASVEILDMRGVIVIWPPLKRKLSAHNAADPDHCLWRRMYRDVEHVGVWIGRDSRPYGVL